MTPQIDRQALTKREKPRTYSPDLLAQMQSLLAEIADLDCALEKDLEAARSSSYSEPVKTKLVKELERRHHEQHAPIAMELAVLEQKIAQELRL